MTELEFSESFPVKPPVSYVIIEHWPENGDGWIHPEDRKKTEGYIPGDFVWRREGIDNPTYPYQLSYGDVTLRTQPVMVEEVPAPEFQMDELVEVISQLESEKAQLGRVYAIRYSHFHEAPEYYLIRGELKSQDPHLAKELAPYDPPKEFHAPFQYDP